MPFLIFAPLLILFFAIYIWVTGEYLKRAVKIDLKKMMDEFDDESEL